MNDSLRKLQLTELEILRVIDSFCKRYQIRYSLYAGTLLGAVRHQGFIPWDDDLDICMEREEYDRFLAAWETDKPAGYLLQNKDNSPGFTQTFTKIRKEHTTFIQEEWEAGRYHTGIFVDVFPVDRIPNGRLKRLLFRWDCLRYLLYTREFIPPKGSSAQKAVSKVLLACTGPERRKNIRKKLIGRITKYNNDRSLHVVMTETVASTEVLYPEDLMDGYSAVSFEGTEFSCITKWREYLEAKFGDYMTPPPEEERTWKHHPIVIDFDRDYEETAFGDGKGI